MNWKDQKLWICAGVYVLILLFLSQISAWGDRYDPAPHRILFEIVTVLVWMTGIYWRWSGRWQQEDNRAWTALLLISAAPHILFSLVGYGSRLCLGGSVLVGAVMYWCNRHN